MHGAETGSLAFWMGRWPVLVVRLSAARVRLSGCQGLRNPFWPPGRTVWLPLGICSGKSLVRGGLAGDRAGGTQKVTANAKNRPDLQGRAGRMAGAEASGRPVMRLHATF